MFRTTKLPTVGAIYRGELTEARQFLFSGTTSAGQRVTISAPGLMEAYRRLAHIAGTYQLDEMPQLALDERAPGRLDDSCMD